MLTSSPTDVLSHVAIRARSQGVLLATCFDEAELASLEALAGKHVVLTVTPSQDVVAREADAPATNGSGTSSFSCSPCLVYNWHRFPPSTRKLEPGRLTIPTHVTQQTTDQLDSPWEPEWTIAQS